MVSIKTKVIDVKESEGNILIILDEGSGAHMYLNLDKQATINLNQMMSGKQVKGGSIADRARGLLLGTNVEINFRQL